LTAARTTRGATAFTPLHTRPLADAKIPGRNFCAALG
jgi:hypothetical protein